MLQVHPPPCKLCGWEGKGGGCTRIDEDLQFVNDNLDYAGFVSRLDTNSISRHVTRVADADENALGALYEKRLRKKAALLKEKGDREADGVEVDPVVDALPVKTLDGQLYYRTLKESENEGDVDGGGEVGDDASSLVRPTKAERRAKLKKSKKDAKKQAEALPQAEDQRSAVLRYQPYALDPNQSGALASVLWELNLLSKHYHPTISSLASGICTDEKQPWITVGFLFWLHISPSAWLFLVLEHALPTRS